MEEKVEISENAVVGRNAVSELIKSGRAVDKIFVKDGVWEGSIKEIAAMAKEKGIPLVSCGKSKLDKLAPGMAHQGIIAFAAEKEYCSVDDIISYAKSKGEEPFIVIADGINDPHNLGALIRCAEAAGCHGLIIPKRRSVTLTATVSKASAGAIEHLRIAKVTNLGVTVDELKRKGVWIYSAEADGTDIDKTEIITPAAFVLGSEGQGVSRLIKEKSDFIVSIPMKGKVNSLNVSSAGAVILFHARKYFN
ncbi:MAG: 23S rRNA (guanosine(2251)-2'-O)-methyltransferase RlmB [Clostridia bacterium]|nr:23S rRNA (guanosine(2251)-2'-O)-methyltransferase RlmB [Clostridia bacterium]